MSRIQVFYYFVTDKINDEEMKSNTLVSLSLVYAINS